MLLSRFNLFVFFLVLPLSSGCYTLINGSPKVKIRPAPNVRIAGQTAIPYQSFLLTSVSSSEKIVVARDPRDMNPKWKTNSFIVEEYDDTLKTVWSTKIVFHKDSALSPFHIGTAGDTVILLAAQKLPDDSVRILRHRIVSGAIESEQEIARFGRDKEKKRGGYRVTLSPNNENALFYAFTPTMVKDSVDVLDVNGTLYNTKTNKVTSFSFKHAPIIASRHKEAHHLSLPILYHQNGTFFELLHEGKKTRFPFDSDVFILPVEESEQQCVVSNDGRFCMVGKAPDTTVQVGIFDPLSGKKSAMQIVLQGGGMIPSDFRISSVSMAWHGSDSLGIFLFFRDRAVFPFYVAAGRIPLNGSTPPAIRVYAIKKEVSIRNNGTPRIRFTTTDDELYPRGVSFLSNGEMLLFLQNIYTDFSRIQTEYGATYSSYTVEGKVSSAVVGDSIKWQNHDRKPKFYYVPFILDGSAPSTLLQFIEYSEKDTLYLTSMQRNSGELRGRLPLMRSNHFIDRSATKRINQTSYLLTLGAEKYTQLIRVETPHDSGSTF